ncbi:hypothetical protein RND81_02G020000 [Saponaria officinalis]|uniref:Transmembrane protein n=1 Tax=Saponaria officinalis TaxID=3572 RepID=A0AAW1MQH6_SAPOF
MLTSKMHTLLKNSPIIILLLLFITTGFSSTATSFTNDNRRHGWRIIKTKIGEWKVVAPPGVNKMVTQNRRNLKDTPLFQRQPSPRRAPASHGGAVGGGIP